jgi:hypothetical protein
VPRLAKVRLCLIANEDIRGRWLTTLGAYQARKYNARHPEPEKIGGQGALLCKPVVIVNGLTARAVVG